MVTIALTRLALSFLLAAPHPIAPPAEGIAWEPKSEEALARAREQKKVLFLAINVDGERACERLADKVYRDKTIVALAASTLNLVASPSGHADGDRPCTRFRGLRCGDHQKIDVWARKDVLRPDVEGYVIAPQHVFLDPEGKVILSAPYEVTTGELAWCWVTALHLADPQSKVAMPAAGRAPRRLILGGVWEPVSSASVGPATREEVLRLVKTIKKGLQDAEKLDALRRILSSDEPEGIEYVRTELRTGGGGSGGGGGGGQPGPGGGGGGDFGGSAGGVAAGGGGGGDDNRALLLHSIGALSPPSYWEVVAEFAIGVENELRIEAAVALEQLAAPASLKTVQSALSKENHPEIKKEWIRALAAVGSSDAVVQRDLLKRARSEKDELLRLNSIVALGSLAPGDDVAQALSNILKQGAPAERAAAACAMAITRDPKWLSELEAAATGASDPQVTEACTAAAASLKSGGLSSIRPILRKVAQDKVERDRWFGTVPVPR